MHKTAWAIPPIFACLLFIVFVTYANTFSASWHLDDRPNIVNNYYLHLDSLAPDKLVKTLFTNPHNPEKLGNDLYRPVACLTFALNWYFGQDNVFGYHLVNTFIHALIAFFLFLFIVNLFKTPNLERKYTVNPILVAFLASLLWAVNPIQTQAVTYIVQRMAQLAALFYILGLYGYIKARLSFSFNRSILWLAACLIFYLLGIFSKPNAAMLPLALVLVEIIFFQNIADRQTRKKIYFAALSVVVLVFLLGTTLFLGGNIMALFSGTGFQGRSFTLLERLLAQPRVVVFYLSQIFYPAPDRLSIAHDIVLSSSPLKPWTTIPSILIIFSLIGFALAQIRKWPVLSFSILFFFLNHIIESSIIPLEIIFEHRNYLPSFFLFMPVAYLLNYLLVSYKQRNQAIHALTIIFIAGVVILFSAGTFIRNQAWQNDITLWQDAVAKAPNNARASNILAIRLAWGDHSRHPKRYDMALKLFRDSLEKHVPRKHTKADIYGNMALIHFHKKNNPQKALEYFDKALEINPGNLKIRRDLVNALILQKDFDTALKHVNMLIAKNQNNGIYHNLKGHILLWKEKYEPALSHFKQAYNLLSNKDSVILNTAVTLSLDGNYEDAESLLQTALSNRPGDMTFYFAAIENSIRDGKNHRALKYAERLFHQFDKQQIKQGLEFYTDNPKYAPISKNIIEPLISEQFKSPEAG